MFQLVFNSVLLGAGLAMDAFSVSIANGILEPAMKKRRMFMISGVYAFFQFIMPMLGWVLVTTLEEMFTKFSNLMVRQALAKPKLPRLWLLRWIGIWFACSAMRG